MQIDTIGKRYGLLPSEVIRRADSFDLYIMDAALTFEQHHNKRLETGKEPVPNFSEEELLQIHSKNKRKK
jgi:hypothetical protein